MITFYEALGGAEWIERDFWASGRPVGQWHGVQTDGDGRVVQLTIYDNNLTGELSPAICQLERLHTLHLSFNKISGALPEGLGDCDSAGVSLKERHRQPDGERLAQAARSSPQMCAIFATIVDFRSQKHISRLNWTAARRHMIDEQRGLAMCLRDGFEAATWVGFSAAALLAVVTPLIFLI